LSKALTINLSRDEEAAVNASAWAQGLSSEEYARHVPARELEVSDF